MLNSDEAREIIKNGFNLELMRKVEDLGNFVKAEGLSTSQIRHIFTKIKEIEAKGIEKMEAELLMMKPLTAYAAKRHNKKGLSTFKQVIIDNGIEEVLSAKEPGIKKERFANFVKLVEAVLAYHKAAGGK